MIHSLGGSEEDYTPFSGKLRAPDLKIAAVSFVICMFCFVFSILGFKLWALCHPKAIKNTLKIQLHLLIYSFIEINNPALLVILLHVGYWVEFVSLRSSFVIPLSCLDSCNGSESISP